MKNAIEAEKAKSAKIENDLKLEIEKMKAELNAELNAEEAKHDKTLFLANVVARYNKSIKKFETRTDISNFSTSSYMTDEEEEDNQSIESMYSTTSSTIDEDEELDELKFELELQKASNARLVSALKTLATSANYNEISTRFIEQVIINQDIETKFEYMKTKFDNEKKYNSELNDVIERLYAIINNRKFED
jgi:hypothetical protein